MQEAIGNINNFKADMGMTELNGALEFSYNSEKIPHTPCMVYLLTDGDVENPDSLIAITKKHSKKCRTFTIGVGSDASPYLVR